MSNIASVLKEEITRLARKELRNETASLKKASAQYRSDIAALKRRILALEQQLSRIQKSAPKKPDVAVKSGVDSRVRFTANGLRTLRQRLGLSANDMAKLIGASAQSIYKWESETARPRKQQIAAIAAIRGLGKKEAVARLEKLAE